MEMGIGPISRGETKIGEDERVTTNSKEEVKLTALIFLLIKNYNSKNIVQNTVVRWLTSVLGIKVLGYGKSHSEGNLLIEKFTFGRLSIL